MTAALNAYRAFRASREAANQAEFESENPQLFQIYADIMAMRYEAEHHE